MKTRKTQLILAAGATLAATTSLPTVMAADNPFSMQTLDRGYQLAQANMDGKKADGKCGADKKKDASCGSSKKKDASCGGDKKKDASCGGDKKKDASCGGDKKKDASCGGKK